MSAIAAFFAKPAIKYGLIVLAVLGIAFAVWLALHGEFKKGEATGKATVTNAVQTETIKKIEDARQSKEKTDEIVRQTPYDDKVEGLK